MQAVTVTTSRSDFAPRTLHIKRLRLAASWRRQAVVALRSGDRVSWRRLMSYCCAEADSAARYRMEHMDAMRLPS